jgi:hypothetical protein
MWFPKRSFQPRMSYILRGSIVCFIIPDTIHNRGCPFGGPTVLRVWFLWDLDPHIQWSKQTWLESIIIHPCFMEKSSIDNLGLLSNHLWFLDISGYFWGEWSWDVLGLTLVGYRGWIFLEGWIRLIFFTHVVRRDITKSGRRPDPLGGWARIPSGIGSWHPVATVASKFRVLSIP